METKDVYFLVGGQSLIDGWFRHEGVTEAFATQYKAHNPDVENVHLIDVATGGSGILRSSMEFLVDAKRLDPESVDAQKVLRNHWYDEITGSNGPVLDIFLPHVQKLKDQGVEFEGMIWAQGEADSPGFGDNFSEQYQTGLTHVFEQFRSVGDFDNIYIQGLGRHSVFSERLHSGKDDIRAIQQFLADNDPNIQLATTIYDLDLADSVHLTPEGFAQAAIRMADFIGSGNSSPQVMAIEAENNTIALYVDTHGKTLDASTLFTDTLRVHLDGQDIVITGIRLLDDAIIELTTEEFLTSGILEVYIAHDELVPGLDTNHVIRTEDGLPLHIGPVEVLLDIPPISDPSLPSPVVAADAPQKIYGSNAADDIIEGGNNKDHLVGLGGDDLLVGNLGDDLIEGRDGHDQLYGGAGQDRLAGHGGNDLLAGGSGDDNLQGGAGRDVLYGNEGNDRLIGGDDVDFLVGGSGRDVLKGGKGNDTLFGGLDADHVYGGNDDDVLYGNENNDRVVGEQGDDIVFGGAGDDLVEGREGNDIVRGGAGNDRVFGQEGDDILFGDDGDDTIMDHVGTNQMYGGAGNDTLYGGSGNELLDGGDGNDYLKGQGGNDTLFGGDGDDKVIGDTGNDLQFGGAGNDKVYGFDGDDELHGDAGNDRVVGQDGNDRVFGNDGDDIVEGRNDDDQVFGGAGNDLVLGQSGNDFLDGGTGIDRLQGGAGDDILIYDSLDNQVHGGSGFDTLVMDVESFNLTNGHAVREMEHFELDQTSAQTVTVSFYDIIRFSNTDELFVSGGEEDQIILTDSAAIRQADTMLDGVTYASFSNTDGSSTLSIELGLSLNGEIIV